MVLLRWEYWDMFLLEYSVNYWPVFYYLDNGSSVANTVEMYNAPTLTEDTKSVGTYDRRSFDEYQDDYGKPFDVSDYIKCWCSEPV
jgi:hypothetical protein